VDVVRKGYSVLKRISLLIAVALMAVMMMAATAMPAMAGPLTCPSGQTETKTSDGWACVSNGGSNTGAARHQGGNDFKAGKDKTFP